MRRPVDPVLIAGTVRAAWSGADRGDLRPDPASAGGSEGLERWAGWATASVPGASPVRFVHWMDQVHGAEVVTAVRPGDDGPSGPGWEPTMAVFAGPGDGLVSDSPSCSLAVLTADCASLALGSEAGVFAAVHAGWRGLTGGVVEATVAAMRAMGATEVVGALGPCIHPCCYEFSDQDLDRVAAVHGDGVRGRTSTGRPALDIPVAVSAALAATGARETAGVSACTGCAGGYFSHRARGETGRQALVVWSADRSGRG